MAKPAIPAADLELELTPGSVKGVMKDAGAGSADMWMVPPSALRRIPGFNVRVETPDYIAHRESVAQSIIANGFYRNKPLAGYVAKDGDENVIFVTDGHTRLDAVEIAIRNGAEIEKIPVVVKPAGQTVEDLTVALVQDNNGRPLTPYEMAIVVKRLVGYGWDSDKIAAQLSISVRYVSDLLVIAAAPAKIRDLLLKGKISATEAVKQLRKDAPKAVKTLARATEIAEREGKKKATGKHVRKAEAEENGGKVGAQPTVQTETLVFDFHAGQVVPVDEDFKPVRLLAGADWWEFVDEETKADALITGSLKITVTIERVSAPEPVDPPAEDDDAMFRTEDDAPDGDQTEQADAAPAGDPDLDDAPAEKELEGADHGL